MALLNLDKVEIKRTTIGIICPKCGGDLIPSAIKNMGSKIMHVVSLGTIQVHNYNCKNCKNKFNLF
ncbi:MAG TPA: hypothetical protein VJY62_12335 [Bacteroidia bacterium]|nr:hypothetical protein [Bacteroidia bacterium]